MSTKTDAQAFEALNQPVELPQSGYHRADKYQAAFEFEDDESFQKFLKVRGVPHFVANRKTWIQAEVLFERAVAYEATRKPGWFDLPAKGREVDGRSHGAGEPATEDKDGKDAGSGAAQAAAAPEQGRKPRGRRQ